MEIKSYNGNPLLKQVGQKIEFTRENIKEIQKCKKDPIYFIENYCKIVTLDDGLVLFKMHIYQKQLVDIIVNNRKIIVIQPRQTGKSVLSAAIYVWYTLFNSNYTVGILANKGAAAREVLDRYQIMYENLPIWMQQGVTTWNKGDIELENGSKIFTAATSASGIRGRTVNMLGIDEAAIVANNVAEQFFASTFPTISSGKTTKILITSTPLGYNHFWKMWTEAENGKNGFIPFRVNYWEVPNRDEKWAEEQRKTLGDVKFNQEILCQFLGSSNTLISGDALAMLATEEPVYTDKLQYLKVYRQPDKTRSYVAIVDVSRGIGGDYSAVTVIDVTDTPYFVVARYKDNTIAPMLLPNVVLKLARDYNDAYVLVEANDIGGQVVDILYHDLEYENIFTTAQDNGKTIVTAGFSANTTMGVRTTKSVKRIGCFSIKNMVEEQKLIVTDADTIFEMSTFIEKGGSFQADEGYHDDLVMTLVLFGWLATNTYFKDLTNVDVRQRMYNEQMAQIDESMTPFGFINTGVEEEEFFRNDNCVWSTDKNLPWKELLGY